MVSLSKRAEKGKELRNVYGTGSAMAVLVTLSILITFTCTYVRSVFAFNAVQSRELYASQISFVDRLNHSDRDLKKLRFIYVSVGSDHEFDARVYNDYFKGTPRAFDYVNSLTALFLWDRTTSLRITPSATLRKIDIQPKSGDQFVLLGRSQDEVQRLIASLSLILGAYSPNRIQCYSEPNYPWCYIEYQEMNKIPFNFPYMSGKELIYIAEAQSNGCLAGDGPFTKRCHAWLEERTSSSSALLTHSCTAALEMAALLLDIQPGDEIIMPSYTFVSTANAFVLRGGIPVFVDIREDTLNLDEHLIDAAITPRTRAIVPVHYAGVSCEMDAIMSIAKRHDLKVVEDAAQGVMASYKGRALGSIGDLGAYSFHETKNVISGEGGALLINDRVLTLRAEIYPGKRNRSKSVFPGQRG